MAGLGIKIQFNNIFLDIAFILFLLVLSGNIVLRSQQQNVLAPFMDGIRLYSFILPGV